MNKFIKKIAEIYLSNLSKEEFSTLAYNDVDNNEELEDPTMYDSPKGMFDAGKVASSNLERIAELYEKEADKEDDKEDDNKSKDNESFEDED